MSDKPRLLLMPNVSGWILGEIARQIIAVHGGAYDIYYVSDLVARRRPDLLRSLLKEVDFVHGLSESSVRLVVESGVEPAPPLLTWIHHVTSWSADHELAVEHSHLLVVTTTDWRDRIRAYAPRASDPRVVNYGVDPDVFRPGEPARREFGIPSDAFAIGFVGGRPSDADGSRKGLDTLRATLLRARDVIPKFHVCLVGPGWSGEAAELRQLGISINHVGFLAADRLPSFYRSIDAYLSTSRVEGGPCTVLESMACETPVVATDVGLVPEVVESGVTGYRAAPGDVDALVNGLEAIARNRDAARAMGGAARRRVAKAYAWRTTLAALKEPYAEMAALGQRHRRNRGSIDRRHLLRTVHAADALVWSAAQVRRRQVPPREGLQMLTAMLKPLDIRAVASALALVAQRPRPRKDMPPAQSEEALMPERVVKTNDRL